MVKSINNIKFVNVWVDAVNRGAGVKAVAEKMDMSVQNVSAKATGLRAKGVNLPKMPIKRDDNDIELLNNLIKRKTLVR